MRDQSCSPTALGIIVPVFGNADTLEELAWRIRQALTPVEPDYRLLFVVDASPDASWPVLRRLSADDPRVAALLLRHNHGQHTAILIGMQYCNSEWVAVMDADLQDPPELLSELLRAARRSQRTVFAKRQGRYQSWPRMLSSRIFKLLLQALTGVPYDAGTFFIVSRQTAAAMLSLRIDTPHTPAMAGLCSPHLAHVAFHRPSRPRGRSAYSAAKRLQAGLRALGCVLAYLYSDGQRIPAWHQPQNLVASTLGPTLNSQME